MLKLKIEIPRHKGLCNNAAIHSSLNSASPRQGAYQGLQHGLVLTTVCDAITTIAGDIHDNPVLAGELLIIGAGLVAGLTTGGGFVSIGLAALSTTAVIITDTSNTASFVYDYSMGFTLKLIGDYYFHEFAQIGDIALNGNI